LVLTLAIEQQPLFMGILGENHYEIASSLSLLAMTLQKWFCHCAERSEAISSLMAHGLLCRFAPRNDEKKYL